MTTCSVSSPCSLRLSGSGVRRHLHGDVVAHIEPIGRRNKGKPQLRIDEARRRIDVAVNLAETNAGAVAALISLLTGLRATEIVTREVRDVDDAGMRFAALRCAAVSGSVRRSKIRRPSGSSLRVSCEIHTIVNTETAAS